MHLRRLYGIDRGYRIAERCSRARYFGSSWRRPGFSLLAAPPGRKQSLEILAEAAAPSKDIIRRSRGRQMFERMSAHRNCGVNAVVETFGNFCQDIEGAYGPQSTNCTVGPH